VFYQGLNLIDYKSSQDYYIRISEGNIKPFQKRIGISKETAKKILTYCKSLDKNDFQKTDFEQIKAQLNIPNYEGYELFLDLKNEDIELNGDKILPKKK
jgi:hypothetical protein